MDKATPIRARENSAAEQPRLPAGGPGGGEWTSGGGAGSSASPAGAEPAAESTAPAAAAIAQLSSQNLASLGPKAAVELKDMYRAAEAQKAEFDGKVNDIAKAVNGDAVLLKGGDRATEKILNDYNGDPSRLKDILRATVRVQTADEAQQALSQIKEKFDVLPTGFRNTLTADANPVDGYRDIKLNVRQNGVVGEVQVNLPSMLAAKAENHAPYEARRSLEGTIQREGRNATPEETATIRGLNAQMKSGYDAAWRIALGGKSLDGQLAKRGSRDRRPVIPCRLGVEGTRRVDVPREAVGARPRADGHRDSFDVEELGVGRKGDVFHEGSSSSKPHFTALRREEGSRLDTSTRKRAYSVFEVKDLNEAQRQISGMATTPTTDRVGDIVEPLGIKAAKTIPLLLYHDTRMTVGTVKLGKPTAEGVPFEAQIANVTEPGVLKDRVDEAWQMVKYRLIAAVSIGFREVAGKVEALKNGGLRFLQAEVFELSLVPIPANAEATISSIKSLDESQRAAFGQSLRQVVRLDKSPGVAGTTPRNSRKDTTSMKPISEQIGEFQTKRQAALDRAEEIVNKTLEEGRTRTETEKEEHEAALSEVTEIDEHISMLKAHEQIVVKSATAAPSAAATATPGSAAAVGRVVSVKRNLAPGTAFTRYAMVLAQSKGNLMQAEILARRFDDSTPEVSMAIKAAVAAGTTQDSTWAAPLVQLQEMQSEFIEFLRPQTLLGRIPGLRRVPFNIKFTRQNSGTTGAFVGEGLPKPLGKMDFELLSLTWAKAATIIVMTEELVRFSSPSAEALARDDLAKGIATYLDKRFIDPSFAGVANVSPASITNGVSGSSSSGVTVAAIDHDVTVAIQTFVTANLNLGGLVWVMSPRTALSLGMKRNVNGDATYPNLGASGGTFYGYPVIVSNNVSLTGSPTDSFVVLMDPTEIMLADDGGVTIDMSTEASLQMSDSPTGGATSLVSLWQNNLIGLRAERFINWRKRRDAAVAIINDVNW